MSMGTDCDLSTWLADERAPRIHIMEARRRENESRQRSQPTVLLYD